MRSALLGVVLAVSAFALDTSKLKPTGYLNDFSHVVGAGPKAQIEAYCAAVERATNAQFAIAVVDSLEDDPIEDVANRLYREWGVGKKGNNEGLLLLIAVKDRKQRAEVGYGLEGPIPDGFAGGVLRGIRPILRQGNFGGAILAALQQFGEKIAQDKNVTIEGARPRPVRERSSARGGPSIPFPVIVIGIVGILWLLSKLSGGGRSGGGRGGSGVGGFLTGMFLGNLLGGGGRGGWGGGGFGGSDSGGGGGGFGGFGGGDSGGGGASSDW